MSKEKFQAQHQVDLSGEMCPLAFVQAKLALDEVAPGEVLELILDGGQQLVDISGSMKAEGQEIVKIDRDGGRCRLFIRKAPAD